MGLAAPETEEDRRVSKLIGVAYDAGWYEAAEEVAKMIEGYVPGQIRMAAGEMTAQEMRTVQAVQRWWVSAIRHKFRVECEDGPSPEVKT